MEQKPPVENQPVTTTSTSAVDIPTTPPPKNKMFGWKKYLNYTGIYGFELLMATFGLTVAAVVIDYGMFAFFNHLRSSENSYAVSALGEFSIWIVVAMLVWLPLALVFYLRTRGQLVAEPTRRQAVIHKLLVSLFQFVNVITIIGAVFGLLYSLLRPLITGSGGEEFLDSLIRVSLPALGVAAVHSWLLFAYSRSTRVTRRLFAMVFSIVGIIVMVCLLVTSVGMVRAQALDLKKEQDLSVISTAISDYDSSKNALPKRLDDLTIDEDKLKLPLDEYSYTIQSSNRYELCTRFAATKNFSGKKADSTYNYYANFDSHDKGNYCFKLQTSYFDFNSLNDTSSNSSLRDY